MKTGFDRDHLLNLEYSLRQEYLLTNGKGGYASSTILDCHTRKYHSLLAVPVPEIGGTWNLLSKFEVSVIIDDKEFHLSTNKFPNVYHPTGHKYASRFEFHLFPVTRYVLGDTVIERSLLMPRGHDAVLMKLEVIRSNKPVVFKVDPLLAYRNIHELAHQNMNLQPHAFSLKNGMKVTPYNHLPTLEIQTSTSSHFYPAPEFWKSFEYLKERNRGFAYSEDLFSPGVFEARVRSGGNVIFRATAKPSRRAIKTMWTQEELRLRELDKTFSREREPLRSFKFHADNYLLDYGRNDKGIIAGYHWFGEWGRDTMISLAGLTFCRRDPESGLAILKKYARLQRDGLMPNFLDPQGNHAYNSIDASLLYIRAVQQFFKIGQGAVRAKPGLRKPLEEIVRAFLDGRVPHTRLGEDGLLYAGDHNTQLTWMDAQAGGQPVTPRHGAAVEINALWYNALRFLPDAYGDDLSEGLKTRCEEEATRFADSFLPAFWHGENGCLCDVYRGPDDRDASIRPNQLFALGLHYDLVPEDKLRRAMDVIKIHLVTPYGLRTLSPGDIQYKFIYKGDPDTRDRAYHQGMVWPWLVGVFTDALLRIVDKVEAEAYITKTFRPLLKQHALEAGLHHVSEILTPNPPYSPKGAMAQAWSIAEIIRMLEMLKNRPAAGCGR